jgi:hypothetical protein
VPANFMGERLEHDVEVFKRWRLPTPDCTHDT